MDLSKVGEKILSSVRSLGLIPSVSDRPEVIDAYALLGDTAGLAEKIESFFMQEVISKTHCVLKAVVHEDEEDVSPNSWLTYSDLCCQIPDSKFRKCLLSTLAVLFDVMCSYHEIMDFQLKSKESAAQTSSSCNEGNSCSVGEAKEDSDERGCSNSRGLSATISSQTETTGSPYTDSHDPINEAGKEDIVASSIESSWYHFRKETTTFVSQTLQRERKKLWHLTSSRLLELLSSAAACSASIHQFLKNYEDLSTFILAGEAFCGIEAVEFRQKFKVVCEDYFRAFHRQNVHALKMVLEEETWLNLPPHTVQIVSFAGLIGDGKSLNPSATHSDKPMDMVHTSARRSGFSQWVNGGNPFWQKLSTSKEGHGPNGSIYGEFDGGSNKVSPRKNDSNQVNGANSVSDDDNEGLLADYIDEESQFGRIHSSQTKSSLCLLRSMANYAKLMRKLEVVNVEFFKGMCQLFELFFLFLYGTFGQQNTSSRGKSSTLSLNYQLTTALTRINQDCDKWIKPQSSSLSSFVHTELTHTNPPSMSFGHSSRTTLGLKERCVAVDTLSLVAQILIESKAHLQSMLSQSNSTVVEDFYVHLVDAVPYLVEHVNQTTVRLQLKINGYVGRIAKLKWEVKKLRMEHNGYVDLLLVEFLRYRKQLARAGIRREIQDILLEYGVEVVAETLVEGLSQVKGWGDEGRALMSLDLQVLINGLQHFVTSLDVKPKLQRVQTFINEC